MSKLTKRISKLFSGKKDKSSVKDESSTAAPSATEASSSAPSTTEPAAHATDSPAAATAAASPTRAPKIAVVIYSMYGHIAKLAETAVESAKAAGAEVEIFQVPETLDTEILQKLHAPPKPAYPIAQPDDLLKFDGFLFGIPTRYGNHSAQWRAFWDSTGGIWASGGYYGKYGAVFVTTSTPGGGQEATVYNTMSTFAHHGILYVPFGYKSAFPQLTNLEEPHGGSPWGAGSFAGTDGSRQPSELELGLVKIQATEFVKTVARTL
ncbi:flavoprotein WrbA [Auriculariales sp. MPI-PUGE-AT-0066]|nr:flavoprotein WrbA [Auriculariales sp. MPI-PUGE-AT-0066]